MTPKMKLPTMKALIRSGALTAEQVLEIERYARERERENFLRSVDEEIRLANERRLKNGLPKIKITKASK